MAANPIADLGKNFKLNYTDAIAAGGNPVDCFNKVLVEAGLEDAGFKALAFSLPLDAWLSSIDPAYKTQGTVWTMILFKLAAVDKKIDVKIGGSFSKAKTVADSMDIVREMLKTGDKTALPEHLEAKSWTDNAVGIGIGVGVLAALAAITYHMTKKEDSFE